MSHRVNSATKSPLPWKAVRRSTGLPSSWMQREIAFVLLGALICLTPLYVTADSDDERSLFNGHHIDVPYSTRDIELGRVLERLQDAPQLIQLYGVNSYFNAFGYLSDGYLWERPDHWASPVEFLARGAGDCEDFAIAKYFALRSLGIPDDQIFIAYVWDVSINASHAILIYSRPGAPDLVLDNRTPLISTLSEHADLVPVYGFNVTGAFLMPTSGQPRISSHRRIPYFHPQWADILSKLPSGERVRPPAEAAMPAALKASGEF